MITPSGPSSGGSLFKRVSGAISLKDPTDSFDVPTGRCATAVVAAADSLNKEAADYICPGTADQLTIQAAIDTCTHANGVGGWITGETHLMPGNYSLTDTIDLPIGVGLIGSRHGWASGEGATATVGALLIADGDFPAIQIVDNPKSIEFEWMPWLQGFSITGSNNGAHTNNHGVSLNQDVLCRDINIFDMTVYNMGGSGLRLDGSGKQWIFGGYIENCWGDGIWTKSNGFRLTNMFLYNGGRTSGGNVHFAGYTGDGTVISNCQMRNGNDYEVKTYSSCYRLALIGNTFRSDGTIPAIRVEVNDKDKNISIMGNTFNNYSHAVNVLQGPYYSSHVPRISLYGNILYDTPALLTSSDGNFAVRGNPNITFAGTVGEITRNSGTDTVAAGAVTKNVTHGLDLTPAAGDIVIVPTGVGSAVTQFAITAYSSTTFTVTVDQAPGAPTFPFAWKAIVL